MIPPMIRSALLVFLAVVCVSASAQNTSLKQQVDSVFPDAQALYLNLHQHPELSGHETWTAGVMADKLRALGCDAVVSGIGA